MNREFLTGLGIEDKATIKAILDEHQSVALDLKEEIKTVKSELSTASQDLRTAKRDLAGANATIVTLQNAPKSDDGKDWKAEHDKVKSDFDTYKITVETEKQTAVTTAAIRKQLETDGCNPKLLDLVMKAIDPTAAKLKDGAIENWTELSKPVKEQYADVFGEVKQTGANVGTPPALPSTFNPFKKGEHYSLAAQTELFRKDPALARRMAGEAGIKLTGG